MQQLQIEKQQKEIEERRKKLDAKERQLKDRLRKEKIRDQITLGRIVEASEVNHLSENALFGALLAIRKDSKNEQKVQQWEEDGQAFIKNRKETKGEQIIVSFPSQPTKELKEILKSKRFKWNAFRKEWYGISKLSDIEKVLKGSNAKIEKVEAD